MPIRYDDGFVAYLNGVEVARRNAPQDTTWNAFATAPHGTANGEIALEVINLDSAVGLLQEDDNVLAIQGLNIAADDLDVFLLPQLAATDTGGPQQPGYFETPTPGELNPDAPTTLGPFVEDVSHTPNELGETDDLVVTARIVGSNIPLGDVSTDLSCHVRR